jgi:hypothetical protein
MLPQNVILAALLNDRCRFCVCCSQNISITKNPKPVPLYSFFQILTNDVTKIVLCSAMTEIFYY